MLLRMISGISRWNDAFDMKKADGAGGFVATGDVIADLRTQGNTLSVWKADTQEEIRDAVVALALGRQKVQKLEYCLLDEATIQALGINLKATPGRISGLHDDILNRHRDLIELDFWKLGILAEHMIDFLADENNSTEVLVDQLKEWIGEYRDTGKIDASKVNKKLRESLGWLI